MTEEEKRYNQAEELMGEWEEPYVITPLVRLHMLADLVKLIKQVQQQTAREIIEIVEKDLNGKGGTGIMTAMYLLIESAIKSKYNLNKVGE